MNTLSDLPDSWRTQHLFLLVGSNSLPNYVATNLMARPSATIHLIFTEEVASICGALETAIKQRLPKVTVKPYQVHNADSGEIRVRLQAILEPLKGRVKSQDVGFNYTGGTKVMAVHTYQALAEAFPGLICTYLDAKELFLLRDNPAQAATGVFVRDKCAVSLQEISALHGYELPGAKSIQTQTHVPTLLKKINELYQEPTRRAAWKRWTQEASWKEDNPEHALNLLRTDQHLAPLADFLQELDSLCGGKALARKVADALGVATTNGCKTWFNGTWLEEQTLDVIAQLAPTYGITSYGLMNKRIYRRVGDKQVLRNFQLDVALMHGYQLFAFSCMASEAKASCKEHLLEVYVRARQLGGDEARVALVCGYEKTKELQDEVEDEWFTEGRIRVFGMAELRNLQSHVDQWLKEANRSKRRS